jgi:hypothetical protein
LIRLSSVWLILSRPLEPGLCRGLIYWAVVMVWLCPGCLGYFRLPDTRNI